MGSSRGSQKDFSMRAYIGEISFYPLGTVFIQALIGKCRISKSRRLWPQSSTPSTAHNNNILFKQRLPIHKLMPC